MSPPIPQAEILAEFFVPGIPRPQGNKTGFVPKKKDGSYATHENGAPKVVVVEGCEKKQRDLFHGWRAACAGAARASFRGALIDAAVHVDDVFRFPRPKNHYGTGRNAGQLKAWAVDLAMMSAPDLEKLERALFDAITGVVWVDDSRRNGGTPRKRYVMPGEVPGVYVRIRAACCCGLPRELCPQHGLEI